MMYGLRDVFAYVECSGCGCLQIREYPADLSKYYPDDYYSYSQSDMAGDNFVKRLFVNKSINYIHSGKGLLGRLISKIRPMPHVYAMLNQYKIGKEARILDVGCGAGHFLKRLEWGGFRNLTGIDPFLSADIRYSDRLCIYKKRLEDLSGEFDLITLNHSFEHMEGPLAVLQRLHSLLSNDGLLVISIPILGFAWRHYGVNWVQMDPPRHFYLHSVKSFKMVSAKAGFQIVDTIYNSNEFQFSGSEQYLRDNPLLEADSSQSKRCELLLTPHLRMQFRARAKELNACMDGDQASFYLVKKSDK